MNKQFLLAFPGFFDHRKLFQIAYLLQHIQFHETIYPVLFFRQRFQLLGVPGSQVTDLPDPDIDDTRSEEHTSELQSLMRISYAVFCLKKKKKTQNISNI